MYRLMTLIVALLVANVSLAAEELGKARLEKSPRHQEWIKVKHGNREVSCFIVFPEVKDKATAVVVIHEIFGLSDWVRGVADQLAEAGYIAIAPDLLSGMGAKGGGSAEFSGRDALVKAVSGLPPEQVTADLAATADYVSKLPACNGKLTVGGFCWGGGQAFRFATNRPDLKASFVFYGTGPTDAADIAKINCPVYGFYGGEDARVGATVSKSSELMKAAGKKYDPVTYPGAGHGFMRAGEADDASAANKKGREDAWKRWREILKGI